MLFYCFLYSFINDCTKILFGSNLPVCFISYLLLRYFSLFSWILCWCRKINSLTESVNIFLIYTYWCLFYNFQIINERFAFFGKHQSHHDRERFLLDDNNSLRIFMSTNRKHCQDPVILAGNLTSTLNIFSSKIAMLSATKSYLNLFKKSLLKSEVIPMSAQPHVGGCFASLVDMNSILLCQSSLFFYPHSSHSVTSLGFAWL